MYSIKNESCVQSMATLLLWTQRAPPLALFYELLAVVAQQQHHPMVHAIAEDVVGSGIIARRAQAGGAIDALFPELVPLVLILLRWILWKPFFKKGKSYFCNFLFLFFTFYCFLLFHRFEQKM